MIEHCTSAVCKTTNVYEANRNVLDKKENKHTAALGGGNVSTFDYTVNGIGQRTAIAATGTAFTEGAPTINVGYNNKGEVVNVDHSNPNFSKTYDFDGVGNRVTTTEGSGASVNTVSYEVNDDNQYTTVGGVAQAYDETGNTLTTRLPVDPNNNASLEWNGNNRLTRVTLSDGTVVHMEYDHQGRRYRKVVEKNGVSTYTYWIYDGFNAIAKYTRSSGDTEASLVKTFYWGKHCSDGASKHHHHHHGSGIDSGDGTGGLLVEYEGEDAFFPVFDGNGNITDYLNDAGVVVAHYEYDAFGKDLVSTGLKKDNLDYGFSTRVRDRDLGLLYYNYRYYNTTIGRWISEDPAEHHGGLNHYAVEGNDFVNGWDYLGMWKDKVHYDMIDRWMKSRVNKLPAGSTYKAYRWKCVTINVSKFLKLGNDDTDGTGTMKENFLSAQSVQNSYQHAMRAPSQTVAQARLKMIQFVQAKVVASFEHVRKARRVEGRTKMELLKMRYHMNSAIRLLGNAQHPIADMTSPMHKGFQVWHGLSRVGKAMAHAKGETMEIYKTKHIDAYKTLKSFFDGILDDTLKQ